LHIHCGYTEFFCIDWYFRCATSTVSCTGDEHTRDVFGIFPQNTSKAQAKLRGSMFIRFVYRVDRIYVVLSTRVLSQPAIGHQLWEHRFNLVLMALSRIARGYPFGTGRSRQDYSALRVGILGNISDSQEHCHPPRICER